MSSQITTVETLFDSHFTQDMYDATNHTSIEKASDSLTVSLGEAHDLGEITEEDLLNKSAEYLKQLFIRAQIALECLVNNYDVYLHVRERKVIDQLTEGYTPH